MAIMSLVQYQFGMLCCIRYLLPRSTFTAVLLTYSFSNYKQRYFIPLIKYEGTHFMEAFAHLWIKYFRQCARTSWVFVRDLLCFANVTAWNYRFANMKHTKNVKLPSLHRFCTYLHGNMKDAFALLWRMWTSFCSFLIRTTSAGVSGWRYVREGASWGCV